MNTQPIENASDTDLRLSPAAMERAAKRAREVAVQTGTQIVVSRNGVIEQETPEPEGARPTVQEPVAPYGKKP